MAQGGVVKMQAGGIASTGMPGAGALYGMQKEYVDPLLDRAKVLAQTAGISIEEAYEALVRQAQMNMPDYSMIAPAGMGEMPSLRDAGSRIGDAAVDLASNMPTVKALSDIYGPGLEPALNRAGEIGSELADRASGLGRGISQGLSDADRLLTQDISRSVAPMREFDVAATQRVSDAYDKSGIGAGIGQFVREVPGALGATGSAIMQGIQGLSDYPVVYEPARALQQTFTGSVPEDPTASFLDLTLGDIFGGEDKGDAQVQGKTGAEVQPASKASAGKTFDFLENPFPYYESKGTEADPIASLVTGVAKAQDEVGRTPQRSSDSESGIYGDAISSIDKMLADLSGREAQPSPSLDLSDVIERSKKGTLAETFMRLGAGVAGGDISKGISGAADAASTGRQELSRLEMAERIAQTKAGQEDIRRGEQRDFDIARLGLQRGQLELMDQRLSNDLGKAERVSKGQLFSLVSDLVKEATDDMMTEDRLEAVDRLSAYFMQKYAPLLDIALTEEDLKRLGATYSSSVAGAGSGNRPPLTGFEGG
jgi:hypothetical protein